MFEKKFITIVLIFAMLMGCSGKKEEAMPLNQENIEKYATKIEEKMRKISINTENSPVDKIIMIYKETMEKKMGYDFDKTFRFYILNSNKIVFSGGASFVNLMTPAIAVIAGNTEESLNKSLISQSTFDLMMSGREFNGLNSNPTLELIQALEVIEKCQEHNSNICSVSKFLDTLWLEPLYSQIRNDKRLSELQVNSIETIASGVVTENDLRITEYALNSVVQFDRWGAAELILKPDGSHLRSDDLIVKLTVENDPEFVVNKRKIDAIRKWIAISQLP